MTENTTETVAPVETDEAVVPEPEKGTWQHSLKESTLLKERAGKANKRSSNLLWSGAVTAIGDWVEDEADDDSDAEGLYNQVILYLGKSRKGDASKIKTVAVAVRNNGLKTGDFENLSKAYAQAIALTKTVKVHAAEDTAADEAVSSIEAPKSTSTAEGAAQIVLSKGVDEAARLLLDALGEKNTDAHRSFLRAVSQEVSGRAKPEPKPVVEAKEKTGASQAKAKPSTAKAKPASTKPKPAPKPAPVADEAEVEAPAPVEKPKPKPAVVVQR